MRREAIPDADDGHVVMKGKVKDRGRRRPFIPGPAERKGGLEKVRALSVLALTGEDHGVVHHSASITSPFHTQNVLRIATSSLGLVLS